MAAFPPPQGQLALAKAKAANTPAPPKPLTPGQAVAQAKASGVNVDTGLPAAKPVDNQIKDMQQFLKNRGYNINVDGVRGPQTNAVIAAFHNKVSPQSYNSKGSNATSVPATTPPVTPMPPVSPKAPVVKKQAAVTPAAAPATPYDSIDPYTYAASAANSGFDPQINAAQLQLNQLMPQHLQNNADLQSWYKQLSDMVSGQATQHTTYSTNMLSDYDKAANNAVGQLFGGAANPAAGAASAFNDINHTALEGQSNAQSDFLKNMGPILAAQGTDALRAELGSYGKQNATLQGQVGSLQAAKGQAYTAALAQGQQLATQQDTAKQSLDLAKSLAPSQIKAANASATTAQIQAQNAAATAGANLKLIQANIAKAQATAKAAGGTWNLTNPQDRGSLSQALRTSIGNQQGTLRVSPQVALQNITQALKQAGLDGDPQAQEIAQSVFQEVLNNSHSAKLWRHVTYVNGKLVTAKAKPKTVAEINK